MKLTRHFLVFITCIISFFGEVEAAHMYGRDLSWTCVSSGPDKGKLVFESRYYGPCYPTGLLPSMTISNPLYAIYGGPSSIVFQIDQVQIYDTACASALSGSCGSGEKYVVLFEIIYKSTPVAIYGVPAVNGSRFFLATCCRGTYVNSSGASGGGFYITSTMYPYLNPETGTYDTLGSANNPSCYDNSPQFADAATYIECLKNPSVLNYGCTDPEGDSLHYSWTTPMQSATNGKIWQTGYSSQSQLASSAVYSSNQGGILDSSTGIVTFRTDSPAGYFMTKLRVSSYRNGIILSEVNRDIPVHVADCQNTRQNTIPQLSMKMSNQSTFQPTLHYNAYLGESIEIDLQALDFGLLATGSSIQSPDIRIGGSNASSSPNDDMDCKFPPCAYLDSNSSPSWNGTEFRSTVASIAKFKWTPQCDNMVDLSTSNGYVKERTFTFYLMSQDDFCPVPGDNAATFTITVTDTNSNSWPLTKMEADERDVLLEWQTYTAPNFQSYELFWKNGSASPWTPLTAITNSTSTSYVHSAGQVYSKPYHYRIQINSGLNCYEEDFYRTTHLDASADTMWAYLSWNNPYVNHSFTPMGKFYIERGNSSKTMIIIDSSHMLNDSFTDKNVPVNEWVYYRVKSKDSNLLSTLSNYDSIYIEKKIIDTTDTSSSAVYYNRDLVRPLFYPNPFKESVVIDWPYENGSVRIYSQSGQLITEEKLEKGLNRLELNNYKNGIYLFETHSKSTKTCSQRIIKQ